MPSERIQRQIDGLLDEAEAAVKQSDWAYVRDRAQNALALDPENPDALTYLAAAARILGSEAATPAAASPGETAPAATAVDLVSPVPPAPPPPAPAPEPAPAQPTTFGNGRYRVKRFLGEGGKKKVYLVYDSLLDRDVAFALIKTVGLDDEGLARIQREAQAMGRLGDHPHVVSVYDVGQEGDQPYLVSQLMGGGDVEGLLEKADGHGLPLEQAIRIADEVCRALEHAHRSGIVHRDLKPGNVWLTSDGMAKLGDFGLAVALDRSRLTRAGMMVGTVAYMPPEQALGGQVEPRSDLYSLGCMLYEMVTGRPPFAGKEGVALISQHLSATPEPPSRFRPDLPPSLEDLILRLLEKDPARRPASATDVRQALAAIDPSQQPDRAGAAADAAQHTVFVGRDAELRQAQSAFDNAVSGHGSLLLILGETGIGKTALVEQIASYAGVRGGQALVAQCYEEASPASPPQPFADALRPYLQTRAVALLREELGPSAAEAAALFPELAERLGLPVPTSAEQERSRVTPTVLALLRRLGTGQPLLLVLEDLHAADRATLDLLVQVARNLAGTRLLVAGTYRDVELDRGHPLTATLADLRRATGLSRIQLTGLSTDAVQEMISGLIGRSCPWALAEAVHRQTEGNPLFVQEVVHLLQDEGLLRPDARWRARSTETLLRSIPEGLQEVISRRLARLTPECQRVLSIAAVVGREFRLDVLQQVAGIADDELFSALEEAKTAAVVVEQAATRGQVTYRFVHAFFRQKLYDGIIAPRRIRLHQQIARVLEVTYGPQAADRAAELAEHFSHSSDPADLDKAVGYSEVAAQRALAAGDAGDAVRFLDQALQVEEARQPQDTARRCDILLALGEALGPAGEPLRAVEEVAPAALALAESLDDRTRAARASRIALDGMGRYGAAIMGGTAVWRQWAERADHYAAADSPDRVHADLAMALVRYADHHWSEARLLYRRALDLARTLGDPELIAAAAARNLQGVWMPDEAAARLRLAEDMASPPDGLRPVTQGTLDWLAGLALLNGGQRQPAEQLWRQASDLTERTRGPLLVLYQNAAAGLVALLDGRLTETVAAGAQLVANADDLGMPVFGRYLAGNLTLRAHLYLGHADDALRALSETTQLAGVEVTPRQGPQRLLCLAHLGRTAEAQTALTDLMAAKGMGLEEDQPPAELLAPLLEAAVLLEDRDTAAALAQRLAGLASQAGVGLDPIAVARLLGDAAALNGNPAAARVWYDQALESATRVRNRPEIALTRLCLAELLLPEMEAAGSKREARVRTNDALAHLDFATAEFQAMRMQPSLERALRHRGLLKA